MTRDRYKITEAEKPHFLTCTTVNWLPIFTRPQSVEIVIDSLRYLQRNDHLILYGFVIMENHLHMLASSDDLLRAIGRFKSFTARKIVDLLVENHDDGVLIQLSRAKLTHKRERTYQFWQEGNHPKLIHDRKMMRQKLDYIHANPVRRGYVDDPIHWRYSSARNYAGCDGIFEISTEW